MFVADPKLIESNAARLQPDVLRGLTEMRLLPLRDEHGGVFFGHDMADGTWLIIEPRKSLEASSKDAAWAGGRVSQDGRGFRGAPVTFHDAVTEMLQTPSPVCVDKSGVRSVVDTMVSSHKQAKLTLAERLLEMTPSLDNERDIDQAAPSGLRM